MFSTAVVTGGAGFIGSNLSDRLLSMGIDVVVLDNFSRKGTKANFKWLKNKHPKVRLVRADIAHDLKKVEKAILQADAVFHMAAQVAVTTSVTDPRQDFESNALGTFNVLEASRKSKQNPFLVFASTNKVYGSLEHVALDEGEKAYSFPRGSKGVSEEMPLDFHSPYGCSKGAADQYVRDYSRIYGLSTTVFRQSCIYGHRQFGVEDQGWVAWFTIALLLDKQLTVYGNGKQSRDLLFVDDLIDAFLLAEKKRAQSKGEIFNIGGGSKNTRSILEYLDLLEKRFGKKPKMVFGNERPGDQKIFVSDNSKAEQKLGWECKTSLMDGLEKMFSWIEKNKKEISSVVK